MEGRRQSQSASALLLSCLSSRNPTNSPLPSLIIHLHRIIIMRPLMPMIHHQHEDGFGRVIWHFGAIGEGREFELKEKVDGVFGGGLPFEAIRSLTAERWWRKRG